MANRQNGKQNGKHSGKQRGKARRAQDERGPVPILLLRRAILVRSRLEALGLKQKHAAERAGLSESSISLIMNMERHSQTRTLEKLAPVLGLTLGDLVDPPPVPGEESLAASGIEALATMPPVPRRYPRMWLAADAALDQALAELDQAARAMLHRPRRDEALPRRLVPYLVEVATQRERWRESHGLGALPGQVHLLPAPPTNLPDDAAPNEHDAAP